MWKGIVNKFVDLQQFAEHVSGLQFTGWTPAFVVVHNTSSPTLANYAEWRAHPEKHGNWSPEQWGRNLESYYRGLGWQAGPHAFVCPDGILLFTPFTTPGTHSPAWNSRTWGIETVGEFSLEPFGNGSKDNLIGVLAILHARIGLNPSDYKFGVRGLHFHKEDPITTHKDCPGKNVIKDDLVASVVKQMQELHPGDHIDIPQSSSVAPTQSMTNEELTSVFWLQTSLNKIIGTNLSTDGVLGPQTRAAVKSFQAGNGLVQDGVPGPATRAAIKRAIQ